MKRKINDLIAVIILFLTIRGYREIEYEIPLGVPVSSFFIFLLDEVDKYSAPVSEPLLGSLARAFARSLMWS